MSLKKFDDYKANTNSVVNKLNTVKTSKNSNHNSLVDTNVESVKKYERIRTKAVKKSKKKKLKAQTDTLIVNNKEDLHDQITNSEFDAFSANPYIITEPVYIEAIKSTIFSREDTKFSIKQSYDDLIRSQRQSGRDTSSHVYSNLRTPDVYQKLENPTSVHIYSKLDTVRKNESSRRFEDSTTEFVKSKEKLLKRKAPKRNKKSQTVIKEFPYVILTDLKVGEGEFSETFRAYRYDLGSPVKVAAKLLKSESTNRRSKDANYDSSSIKSLLDEISVLSVLGKHEYVIEYLGVNKTEQNMHYLIFEYAENGNLKRLLDQTRKNLKRETTSMITMNSSFKLRLCYQIASGMEYISGLNIIHKDLAARNILLDENFCAKISDFGCCKSGFLNKLPIRWMAPEALKKLLFTTWSDVWSYGILIWEIYSYGTLPYPGMTEDEVIGRINQWYRLYKPHDCPNEIYAIMLACWKDFQRARPKFSVLKNRFKELCKSYN